MGAQAIQCYCIAFLIVPDKEKITLDMALKTTFILAMKLMEPVFIGQRPFMAQHIKNRLQFYKFLWLI